ncbi:MAG TPA: cytochrome c [Gemmatimonadales bacterium]|nr:cytochrome c [Gemmatimonadales bacterium]
MRYSAASVSFIALFLSTSCEKSETPRASNDSAAGAPVTDTSSTSAPATAVVSVPETTQAKPPTAATPKPPAGAPDTTAAQAPLRDPYHTAPLDTVDAKTYQGWKYYNLNCARCHGEDVLGTSIAPHLILSLKPDGPIPNEAVFLQVVCGGRPDKGMPAWCTLGMSTAQIDTIYSYVKARSEAKMHPGRPARRGG